ncbi:MAG: phosphatidate cytidylyltransferase [Armatimonadota bacterium]
MKVLREVGARAVLAGVGLPLISLIGWLGGWWWYLIAAAIVILCLGEFYSGCFAKGFRPPSLLCYTWALVILVVAKQPPELAWPLLGPVLFVATATIALCCLPSPRQEYIGTVASAVLGLCYFGVGLSFLYFLRNLDLPLRLGHEQVWSFSHRMGGLMLVLLPVWASDTGAFVFGKYFGRHKLSPCLSPAKTVEGALGGLVSTVVLSLLMGSVWIGMSWWHALGLGVVTGVACQFGDAIESAMKRDLGLKDFGTILGPHGGVLDRFDGLVLALPAAHLYLICVLPPYAPIAGL